MHPLAAIAVEQFEQTAFAVFDVVPLLGAHHLGYSIALVSCKMNLFRKKKIC